MTENIRDNPEQRRAFVAKWRAENLAMLGRVAAVVQRAQTPNGDAMPVDRHMIDFTAPMRLSEAALATAAGHAPLAFQAAE